MSEKPKKVTTEPVPAAPKKQSSDLMEVGGRGIQPKTFEEMWRLAQAISSSDLAPKDFRGKPANALVAMQMGYELGLSPMNAIQNIAVVNGRPSLWGDAVLAIVEASGLVADKQEYFEGTPYEDDFKAVCVVKRKNRKEHVVEFSVADAKRAGLWGKESPWKTHPKRMLQMRARGFALRDEFPDVLKGMILAEEAIDITPSGDPLDRSPDVEQKQDELAQRLDEARGKSTQVQGAILPSDAVDAEAEPAASGEPIDENQVERVNQLIFQLEDIEPGAGEAALVASVNQNNLAGLDSKALGEAEAYLKATIQKKTKEKDEPKAPTKEDGAGQRSFV